VSPLAASLASRLADLVGTENVACEPAALAEYRVDGITPTAVLRPGSAAEIPGILRFAAAERLAVIATGGRTKLGVGMPPERYDLALDLGRMNRVLAYDPGDLTLGVEPGLRFAELSARLAAERQFLPLAPAFADRATLGGITGAGADSPLRHGYGRARDYLLGMEFVTGGGVAAKSGGRVVKNVTGYDLHKLLVGSLGTLAVITRINFRTFPLPSEQRAFVASFEDAAGALAICDELARSQLQPRLVEAANPATGRLFAAASARVPEESWAVAIDVGGQAALVERHAREIERMASKAHATEFYSLEGGAREALLGAIREFARIVQEAFPRVAIFRIAALPTAMPGLVGQIGTMAERQGLQAAILVRAAGVIYTALPPPAEESGEGGRMEAACRELMEASLRAGAKPMIERCPVEVKRAVNVWPPSGDELEIARRLKKAFDPQGVLAPGRFQGGL
jgi:glycolate dehydrogenase FAD-binding subunit